MTRPRAPFAPTVGNAATRAADFLLSGFIPEAGFPDFLTGQGSLNLWVSACVGCALRRWSGVRPDASMGGRYSRIEDVLGLLRRLFLGSQREGGWPANSQSPIDAHTTSWVMRFLLGSPGQGDDFRPVYSRLLGYQQADGGFSKYLPERTGEPPTAWTSSHPEVTGMVLQILAAAGLLDGSSRQRAVSYLWQARQGRPLWPAYWLEGETYSTLSCTAALLACGQSLEADDMGELIAELLLRQSADGSWGRETRGISAAFETAFAIKLLLKLGAGRQCWRSVAAGMRWLLLHQLGDGSWCSEPMLRIPHKADEEPWKSENWKPDVPVGTGVLLRDHHRFLTTASVLSALTSFLETAGNRRLVSSARPRDESAVAA